MFVDHQHLGFATGDREYFARIAEAGSGLVDAGRIITSTIHLAASGVLAVVTALAESADRSEYVWTLCVLIVVDDLDRISALEWFEIDDFPAALARLDELAGADVQADPRPPRLENAASRWTRRLNELLNGGTPDEVAGMYATDVVAIDRRSTVSLPTLRGRAAIRDNVQALRDVGFDRLRSEVIAVRGDHLVLQRVAFSTADGREMTTLGLNDWNHGQVVRRVVFDEDALDEAFAELDERYHAGEGAGQAPMLRVGTQFIADLNAQHWAGLVAVLTDDFGFIDHGQVGWPRLDRTEFLAMQQSYLDQIQQRFVVRAVQARGRAVLSTIEIEGVDASGGDFEWRFHTVVVFDTDRRIRSMESYAEPDLEAALARFDELADAVARRTALENAVTELNAAWVEAKNAGRRAELEQLIAPGSTVVSHRFAGILPETEGVDEMRTWSSDDVGFTTQTMEPIAVRGDRLALTRFTATTAEGLISERLEVTESDEQRRFARTEIFDVDALADALETLDHWYASGEGADHANVIEVLSDGYAALGNRDLAKWAALHAPGYTSHDHTLIGFGDLGAGSTQQYVEAALEQARDFVFVPATLDITGRVALVAMPVRASTPGGFEYERDLINVSRLDDDLRIVEDHLFSGDQWPEARTCFQSLASADDATRFAVSNTATRVVLESIARWQSGDLGFDETIAEDVVRYDLRRSVATPTLHGRAAFIANVEAIYGVFDTMVLDPIAIRGDRVALFRVTLSHDGFAATMLGVYETDERGQVVRGTSFDEDDLDRALGEIEDRFVAGEGAAHEYMIRRAGDVRRCGMAADPSAAFRALNTPDCHIDDHRLLSWPTESASDVVDQVRADRGISAPRTTVFSTVEVRGDAVLMTQDDHFVTPEGSEYLKRSLVVTHSVAGLVDRVVCFEPEQHDAARAQFEALGAETRTPYPDNAVVRLLARGTWLSRFVPNHDAFAGLADDLVVRDHRSGVSLPEMHGPDELVAASRAQEDLFGPIEIEPVAVRGDRLALVHTRAVAPSGFEMGGYGIFEIDDAGRQNAMTFFDDDDLLAAIEALDARYAEIAGPERAPAEAARLEEAGLLNRQEWDRFASLFHPDFVAVDHSPLGFRTTDRDGFVDDQTRGMADLVPDVVGVLRKVLTEGRATLAVGTNPGTAADGNAYASDCIEVTRAAADGRALQRDLYAVPQWTEALARFDELASDGRRRPGEPGSPTAPSPPS